MRLLLLLRPPPHGRTDARTHACTRDTRTRDTHTNTFRYTLAEAQGEAAACRSLAAVLFRGGFGLVQDREAAAAWWRKGAEDHNQVQ